MDTMFVERINEGCLGGGETTQHFSASDCWREVNYQVLGLGSHGNLILRPLNHEIWSM